VQVPSEHVSNAGQSVSDWHFDPQVPSTLPGRTMQTCPFEHRAPEPEQLVLGGVELPLLVPLPVNVWLVVSVLQSLSEH
jgi:hypothetical protein